MPKPTTCRPAPFQFPGAPPTPTARPGRYQISTAVSESTRTVRVIVEHLPAGIDLIDYLNRAGFRPV